MATSRRTQGAAAFTPTEQKIVNDDAEANPDWDWIVTEQIQALLSRFNDHILKNRWPMHGNACVKACVRISVFPLHLIDIVATGFSPAPLTESPVDEHAAIMKRLGLSADPMGKAKRRAIAMQGLRSVLAAHHHLPHSPYR